MPSIITDEKIKEDCFDMRFPIAALNVLKPTGSGVQGIKAPPLPLYYPASIKSLGVGLAKTSGLPEAQVVNFIERKVRQEIAGLEEEKVEELPELDIEEEIEIEGFGNVVSRTYTRGAATAAQRQTMFSNIRNRNYPRTSRLFESVDELNRFVEEQTPLIENVGEDIEMQDLDPMGDEGVFFGEGEEAAFGGIEIEGTEEEILERMEQAITEETPLLEEEGLEEALEEGIEMDTFGLRGGALEDPELVPITEEEIAELLAERPAMGEGLITAG